MPGGLSDLVATAFTFSLCEELLLDQLSGAQDGPFLGCLQVLFS